MDDPPRKIVIYVDFFDQPDENAKLVYQGIEIYILPKEKPPE